jgi:hypothetical protein
MMKNLYPATSSVAPIGGNTNTLASFGSSVGSTLGSVKDWLFPQQQGITDFLGSYGIDKTQIPTMDQGKLSNLLNIYNMEQLNQPMGGFDLLTKGMGLYNMFNSWKMQNDYMDMMRDQLGMAREQWQMTKDEVNRIKGVRDKINKQYMS